MNHISEVPLSCVQGSSLVGPMWTKIKIVQTLLMNTFSFSIPNFIKVCLRVLELTDQCSFPYMKSLCELCA